MSLKSSNQVDTNRCELVITVAADEFENAIEKVFKRESKKITLPGFRKGKAPRAFIEKYYGEQVFYEDAINMVYPSALEEAVKEAGIRMIEDQVDFDLLESGKGKDLVFKVVVTTYPEVSIEGYRGIEVTKKSVEVTDDDVDAELARVQDRNSRMVTVEDRAAENGDTVEISLGNDYIPKMLDYKQPIFGVAIPFVIAEIPEDSPNKGLLMPGDSLTAIDGKEMTYLQDVRKYLSEHRDTTVELSMIRDGAPVNIKAKVDTAGLIQVMTRMPKITTKDYDFLTAIPAGIKLTFSTIGSYIKELKLVFNPETEAYKEVGSVISIGSIFPEKWDWFRFWSISALLSIMLGVMNLLPIPGLDGGHILFTLYEMITRHKPSDKFLMRAQAVGMLLLIMIIFLAFWNDLRNFVF